MNDDREYLPPEDVLSEDGELGVERVGLSSDDLTPETDGAFFDSDDVMVMEGCEEEVAPEEDRVFGMPRLTFRCIIIGYGCGLLAAGLIGMTGLVEISSSSIPGIAGGVIGYAVSKLILQKRAQEAETKE